MIFDLYKAHRIMQSDKYGYFGKLLQLRKTGLTYKEIYKFVDLYLELYPDTPFKTFKPDNEK